MTEPTWMPASDVKSGVDARRMQSRPFRRVAATKKCRTGSIELTFVDERGRHRPMRYQPDDMLEVRP